MAHNVLGDIEESVRGGRTVSSSRHTFLLLDALRGIAAISVVMVHYGLLVSIPKTFVFGPMPSAYLAVDFFFLLSGFVIAHAYEQRLLMGQSLREFMTRRVIRLYPLYLLGTSILVLSTTGETLLGLHHPAFKRSIATYVVSLFFLPTPVIISGPIAGPDFADFPLDGPAWSLSLEIGVNIIYAFFCRKLTTPRLVSVVTIAAILLIISSCYFKTVNTGANWSGYLGGWARVLFSFPMGVLTYRAYCAKGLRFLPHWTATIPCCLLLMIFSVSRHLVPVDLFQVFIVFPVIIFYSAAIPINDRFQRLSAWLGTISYAVYILHIPILFTLFQFYGALQIDPRGHVLANCSFWLFLVLSVAWLADVTYDIPMRKWLTAHLLRSPLSCG